MIRLNSVNWVHNYDDLDNYIPKVGEEYQVLCHEGHFEENASLINGHVIWCEPQSDFYDWEKAEDIINSYVVRGELKRVKEYPFDDELVRDSGNYMHEQMAEPYHVLSTVHVNEITPFVSFVDKEGGVESVSGNSSFYLDHLWLDDRYRKCKLSDRLIYIERGNEYMDHQFIFEETGMQRSFYKFKFVDVPQYVLKYARSHYYTYANYSEVFNYRLTKRENKKLFEINQKAKELG